MQLNCLTSLQGEKRQQDKGMKDIKEWKKRDMNEDMYDVISVGF
jgi:hypothetical protein